MTLCHLAEGRCVRYLVSILLSTLVHAIVLLFLIGSPRLTTPMPPPIRVTLLQAAPPPPPAAAPPALREPPAPFVEAPAHPVPEKSKPIRPKIASAPKPV